MQTIKQDNSKFRKGFTVLEALMAMLVLGFVVASILVVMENSIASLGDLKLRTQAFELARENMEMLLVENEITESSDSGTSDLYPEIEWETSIKAQDAGGDSSGMWVKAKSSASYKDSQDELQEIELEQWVTALDEKQAKQIQKLREMQAEEEGVEPEVTPEDSDKPEEDPDEKDSPEDSDKPDEKDEDRPQISDEKMWELVMKFLGDEITYEELVKQLGW